MGLKLRRFRHRMSLEPVPGLGSFRGTVQVRQDPDHQEIAERKEEGSFFGRYRRMEDGFEPETAERKPVSNVGIPAYVMARKPKLDLHLPSVMKKMYGNRSSREEIIRNGIATNDFNDNHQPAVDFAKNQQRFDRLGTDEVSLVEDSVGLQKEDRRSRQKSGKKTGEIVANREETKPKKRSVLNFRNRGNKTRSLVVNSQPVVKTIPDYDIDNDPAYQRITKIADDSGYVGIKSENNGDFLQLRTKSVLNGTKTDPGYEIDEEPRNHKVSKNVTRVEIKPESSSTENDVSISCNRSSLDQNHITIRTIPDYDIDDEANAVTLKNEQNVIKIPELQYSQVLLKSKDRRSSFSGSLVYEHDVATNFIQNNNHQWYNEKFVRNGTDNDVEYLELSSETSQNDFAVRSNGYSREWYEDEESEKESNVTRSDEENTELNISLEKDGNKINNQDIYHKKDQGKISSDSLFMKDLRLQVYPIENIDEDWGYHGSNDQSYNEQDNADHMKKAYGEEEQTGMKRERQRQWAPTAKTVTFITPSEQSCSSRTSLGSDDIFDAWEMVEECERNLRIREDKELEYREEMMNGKNREEYSSGLNLQIPVPSPRLSIQHKVKNVIGNSETSMKYKAVVSELKKTRSYSEVEV